MSDEGKRALMSELLDMSMEEFERRRDYIRPDANITQEEINDCIEVKEYVDGDREKFSDEVATYVDGDPMFEKWTEVCPTNYGPGMASKATIKIKNKFPKSVKIEIVEDED